MDLEPVRDSFILYARWYTCISAFSAKAQGLAFKAVCEYALFDIPIPKVGFSQLEYNSLLSFLPVIDSNRRRYENGKKGALHGYKGGRPRKDKTPEGLLNETPEEASEKSPKGLSEENPNDNVNYNTNNNVDVDCAQVATPKYIYNLLLPVFFFRNCNAPYEIRRFYNHYRLAEWRLTGGDLLDTPKRLKIAAERWRVEDPKPFYPSGFVTIWRDIYDMAPEELKKDVLEISSSTKMPASITIICSAHLHKWLTSPEVSPRFAWLQQNKTSRPYRIDVVPRKEKSN